MITRSIFFPGEFVAQFKFTLLLMPNGPMKITGLQFDEAFYSSEHTIEDEEIKVATSFVDEIALTVVTQLNTY